MRLHNNIIVMLVEPFNPTFNHCYDMQVFWFTSHFHIIDNEYITRTLGSTRQLDLHKHININQCFMYLILYIVPLTIR